MSISGSSNLRNLSQDSRKKFCASLLNAAKTTGLYFFHYLCSVNTWSITQ